VFLFLRHVQQIAEKKIGDDISAPSRAEELKDSSTEDYLLEFVKVDESAHLETVATEHTSKKQAMDTLMNEFNSPIKRLNSNAKEILNALIMRDDVVLRG